MVDSGAFNCFMHSKVIQHLNATTVDVLAIKFTLADGSYIDCSTAATLYLTLYGNLHNSPFGVSKTVYVGCYVCVMFCQI